MQPADNREHRREMDGAATVRWFASDDGLIHLYQPDNGDAWIAGDGRWIFP